MKKVLKITGIIFLVLLILIIAVPFLFKGKIMEKVNAVINENVNAEVKYADVNISLIRSFPNFMFELTELSVVGKEKFEGDTLVSVRSFYTELGLMSVIFGDEIEIRKIELEQPRIFITILPDSSANYDIAIETADTLPQEEEPQEESAMKIGLKKVEITDGYVSYNDMTSDMAVIINDLDLLLKGDMTESKTSLLFETTIQQFTFEYEKNKYLNEASLAWNAEIDADLDNFRFDFKENTAKLNEIDLNFNGWAAMPEADIDMDLTFATGETDFKEVLSLIPAFYMNDYEGLSASGKFNCEGYAKGLLSDSIMPAFGIKLLVENAGFSYPDLPEKAENINVDMAVAAPEGTYDEMNIDINKFHLEMATVPVDAQMHVAMTATDVIMNGFVKGKVVLENIKNLMPLDSTNLAGTIEADLSFDGKLSDIENENYQNFKALGFFQITNLLYETSDMPKMLIKTTKLALSPQNVTLSEFDMMLGKSDIQLKGKIDNLFSYYFNDELLTADFALTSTLFDANEFLSDEETVTTETTEDTATITAFEVPENIDFTFQSKLNKVLYDKLEINSVNGIIYLKNEELRLQQLAMQLLGGSMTMTGSYNSADITKPLADFTFDIKNFDIQETFKAFNTVQKIAPLAENCRGKISLGLKMETELQNDLSPDLQTIDMNGTISSQSIAFVNSPFFALLADYLKDDKYKNPTMKSFSAAFEMKDGELTLQPFDVDVAGKTATIKGKQRIDLSMEYSISTKVAAAKVAAAIGNLVEGVQMSDELDVEILIGNTILEPKITGIKSDAVKDAVGQVVEEIKEDVKAEAEKILAEAQAKADAIRKKAKEEADALEKNAKIAADKLLEEAKKEGDKLIEQAGNPVAKQLAKKAAEELLEKAKKEADKKIEEAKQAGLKKISDADKEAEKIMKDAQNQVDNL